MSDGADLGREFVAKYDWSFPVIDDEGWQEAGKLGVNGHPAVILVDRRGRLVDGFFGPGDPASWNALLAQVE